jgi:hypothetical protein
VVPGLREDRRMDHDIAAVMDRLAGEDLLPEVSAWG